MLCWITYLLKLKYHWSVNFCYMMTVLFHVVDNCYTCTAIRLWYHSSSIMTLRSTVCWWQFLIIIRLCWQSSTSSLQKDLQFSVKTWTCVHHTSTGRYRRWSLQTIFTGESCTSSHGSQKHVWPVGVSTWRIWRTRNDVKAPGPFCSINSVWTMAEWMSQGKVRAAILVDSVDCTLWTFRIQFCEITT